MKKVFFVQCALSLGLLISSSQLLAQTWTQTGAASPSTFTLRSGIVGIGNFGLSNSVYSNPNGALLHIQQAEGSALSDIRITRNFLTWAISMPAITSTTSSDALEFKNASNLIPLRLAGANVTVPTGTLTVSAGTVGIGTAAPASSTARLAVNGNIKMGSTLIGTTAATVPFRIVADNAVANVNPYIEMYSNNSTVANTKGNIHFITNSSSGNKGQYRFGTQNGNTWTNMMVIDANGKIVMGISDPNKEAQVIGSTETYKLYLGGGLRTEKVRVDLQSSWADYAFEDNYNLMPLADLEAYIQTNKHLPNVPVAAEVEKEGIDVSEMLKIQMEKTEELTLYILQLNERIKSLESVIANQTSK